MTISLATFFVAYLIVFGFGSYYLAKLLRKGPDPVEAMPGADSLALKSRRPLSVPDEGLEGRPGRGAPGPYLPNRETRMFGFGTEYVGWAFWLPLLWAVILGVAITMYVVVDGFDLGIGIMFTTA